MIDNALNLYDTKLKKVSLSYQIPFRACNSYLVLEYAITPLTTDDQPYSL